MQPESELEHLSLKCRIYRPTRGVHHSPCSGGCDKLHGQEEPLELRQAPCECECHAVQGAKRR